MSTRTVALSRIALALVVLGGILASPTPAREKTHGKATSERDENAFPGELLRVEEGNIPILLSVPHGGDKPLPGVPKRTGKGRRNFLALRDTYTIELAEVTLQALRKNGMRPYLVMAHASRKYVDANRSLADGAEHPIAEAYHQAYHAALAQAVQAMEAKWGGGLILDLHGQSRAKETVYRGTRHGRLVRPLVAVHGEAAVLGPKSVLGWLAGKGHDIDPMDLTTREAMSGGSIVADHASAATSAIQLEVGRNIRFDKKRRAGFARDLADAIEVFLTVYPYTPAKDKVPAKEKTPATAEP